MTEPPWRELFPEGRTIFYEGDEPEKFAQEILAEFGFDPSADDRWAPNSFTVHRNTWMQYTEVTDGRWGLE
jgi:hypothetical protein